MGDVFVSGCKLCAFGGIGLGAAVENSNKRKSCGVFGEIAWKNRGYRGAKHFAAVVYFGRQHDDTGVH